MSIPGMLLCAYEACLWSCRVKVGQEFLEVVVWRIANRNIRKVWIHNVFTNVLYSVLLSESCDRVSTNNIM